MGRLEHRLQATLRKKMGSYIALDIELEAIKSFLDKTLVTVDTEIAVICEQEEAGEFRNGNALFNPMQQEKIAVKAVFYEINALVEWELQHFASEAYHNSNRFTKTPKSLLDVPPDQISRIKFIWDLPFGEICRLIEGYYEIKLCEVPGFNEIQSMRSTVNAFKHRKGFKDFRKYPEVKLGEEFKPSRAEAYKAINEARTFIRALGEKLKA